MQIGLPTLPLPRLVEISRPDWDRRPHGGVPAGWVASDGTTFVNGGYVVSQQAADATTVARADRWFGSFYGATARVNIALGREVRVLGAHVSEAQAIEAARLLAAKPGAPSLALVRAGADLVVREALSPPFRSPYATGMHARPSAPWGAFRVSNQGGDTTGSWDETGRAEVLQFTNDAVRAIIDGSSVFRNPSR